MNKNAVKIGKKDFSEFLFDCFKWFVTVVFVVLCVYPIYYVIVYSLSDPQSAKSGVWLWPVDFTVSTYLKVLKRNDIVPAFGISVLRTILGTVISVFCTSLLAFLMTRKEMLARKFVYRFFIVTMYLDAGIVPWYIVMKMYGLQNNFWLYILPGAVGVYNMILIKTFMEQLPESLEESAAIEGAGFFDIFFRIIIPISKPIIATICVYCAVGQWNSWRDNYFLNTDSSLKTVQLILREYINQAKAVVDSMEKMGMSAESMGIQVTPEAVQMTAVVITMVPVMFVYPFAQKYFTKGIMVGAIKG